MHIKAMGYSTDNTHQSHRKWMRQVRLVIESLNALLHQCTFWLSCSWFLASSASPQRIPDAGSPYHSFQLPPYILAQLPAELRPFAELHSECLRMADRCKLASPWRHDPWSLENHHAWTPDNEPSIEWWTKTLTDLKDSAKKNNRFQKLDGEWVRLYWGSDHEEIARIRFPDMAIKADQHLPYPKARSLYYLVLVHSILKDSKMYYIRDPNSPL